MSPVFKLLPEDLKQNMCGKKNILPSPLDKVKIIDMKM